MKGRNHLLTHTIIFGTFLFLLTISSTLDDLLFFFYSLYSFESFPILCIALILYFLGAILPDSDSNDRGSYIFYSKFFLIGYLVRLLEYPLALLLRREIKHRESLHTLLGVFASSLFVSLLLWALFSHFILGSYLFSILLLWFSSLLLGQLLHLAEDRHFYFK